MWFGLISTKRKQTFTAADLLAIVGPRMDAAAREDKWKCQSLLCTLLWLQMAKAASRSSVPREQERCRGMQQPAFYHMRH